MGVSGDRHLAFSYTLLLMGSLSGFLFSSFCFLYDEACGSLSFFPEFVSTDVLPFPPRDFSCFMRFLTNVFSLFFCFRAPVPFFENEDPRCFPIFLRSESACGSD